LVRIQVPQPVDIIQEIAFSCLSGRGFYSRAASIALRQGTRIIKRHDGEPKPEPLIERDPNLKSWPPA
jgi:hypothetical protein